MKKNKNVLLVYVNEFTFEPTNTCHTSTNHNIVIGWDFIFSTYPFNESFEFLKFLQHALCK
jgi:hypothetical protein